MPAASTNSRAAFSAMLAALAPKLHKHSTTTTKNHRDLSVILVILNTRVIRHQDQTPATPHRSAQCQLARRGPASPTQ